MFLEKSSVFKQFSHRKIPVRQAGRDQPDIYFGKVEFTLAFDPSQLSQLHLNCQSEFSPSPSQLNFLYNAGMLFVLAIIDTGKHPDHGIL